MAFNKLRKTKIIYGSRYIVHSQCTRELWVGSSPLHDNPRNRVSFTVKAITRKHPRDCLMSAKWTSFEFCHSYVFGSLPHLHFKLVLLGLWLVNIHIKNVFYETGCFSLKFMCVCGQLFDRILWAQGQFFKIIKLDCWAASLLSVVITQLS